MVFAYRTIVSKHILYQGVRINTGTLGQPFITLGQIDAVTLHPCRNPSEVLAEGFAVREVYFIVEFVVLAVDAKIADSFSNDANTKFCPVDEIPDGWEGLDIGPETEKIFADVIKNSKTILWNGPTGVFEFENFTHGSRAVGEAIVEATKNGAFSLVGGGDSVACVNKFGLASGVSYVSTGGGALLEAIEGKILPGIAAINE